MEKFLNNLKKMPQKFYFYIDESWDHSLQNINEDFPYFLLCGVLISETENEKLNKKIIALKNNFFKTDKAILHSRDVRKCEKHFQVFFDLKIKKRNVWLYEKIALIKKKDTTPKYMYTIQMRNYGRKILLE